jgi:hypothetical protein
MPVKLTNLSGNGSVKPNSLINYNYSEEVTSLEPSSTAGATSQVTVTALSVDGDEGNVLLDSKLLINNEMTLTNDPIGDVTFRVKNVSKNLDTVYITGDTIQARLNSERQSPPVGGEGATLLTAINFYCELVGVIPVIDGDFADELDLVSVNFIGWKGVVWQKLKELCAGVSASITDNVGIEMIIIDDELVFRKAKQNPIEIKRDLFGESINIDSFETTESVTVYNYNTRYGENEVFYELSNYDNTKPIEERFNSSISDSMQVNPGETLRKRFTVDVTFDDFNQPACVEEIDRTFPSPYEGGPGRFGEYVIVGVDDLPIKPEQWVENGGSVTITDIDENGEGLPPGQIELVITAPRLTGLPKAADETQIAFAPYKIGVESSGGTDYPALWLTGTGVFYDKKPKKFLTGSSYEYTSAAEGPTVDNMFITEGFNCSSRGVAAAQANCGPKITLNQQLTDGISFGDVGSITQFELNQYRIESASFTDASITIRSSALLSFGEWNPIWTDLTFEDFTETALDPEVFPDEAVKFNEFTVIPKIGA